jgi:hypothetical protein
VYFGSCLHFSLQIKQAVSSIGNLIPIYQSTRRHNSEFRDHTYVSSNCILFLPKPLPVHRPPKLLLMMGKILPETC